MEYVLTLMTFLPALGIPLLWVVKDDRKSQKMVAAVTCFVTMCLSIFVWLNYDAATAGELGSTQFMVKKAWIDVGDFKIHYYMDVDGFSVLLTVLTGILGFLALFAADSISGRVRGFYAMYLLLMTGMMGTFVAMDLFLFYIFWELMLLPMYFLIGIWGGPKREYAAIKFFVYTLVGSVLMLGAFLAIFFQLNTFEIPEILAQQEKIFPGNNVLRMVLFWALFIGFAIKIPVFPFHTWLPLAHVEAPTPISVILAGVLLKMGGYGLVRMAYPWFPDAVVQAWPVLATLAVVSIIYGAFVAMGQTDWKKLVAYSSVSHMGYVLLGLSALTAEGVNGAVLQMFSHGTISAMMFLLVGVMYDQVHHRDMNRFGGLLKTLPVYSFISMVGFFAALGLPGMSGFVAEMMVFFGSFRSELPDAKLYTLLGTIGIVVGAVYILVMLQKIYLGTPREKPEHALQDMRWTDRNGFMLVPLAAITIWLGIWPNTAIKVIDKPIQDWLVAFEPHIEDAKAEAEMEEALDTGKLPAGLTTETREE
jgi:NADH-quinone oxidoreductase subunit M